jgi:hypothetical protein
MGKLSGSAIVTPARPLLVDAMTPVVDALTAAGIRVTLDVKRINPPGCYLHPPELVMRWRAGDFTATHRLLVVAAASDRAASYVAISDLIDQVLQALGDAPVTLRPAAVETSDVSTYLTAYDLIWTDRVRQITEGNQP